MKKVAIVDYDMGNIDSVLRAFEECGAQAYLASTNDDFADASYIVLPGVGSFKDGMDNIRTRGLDKVLHNQVIEQKVPFLGICLGMQLLADQGWEGGQTKGLGWIKGEVKKMDIAGKNLRLPHVGWNEVIIKKPDTIFRDFPTQKDFYFVHSYHFHCTQKENVLARTQYAGEFVSAVGRDNIFGVQFHPEKSQKAGFKLIQNFLSL